MSATEDTRGVPSSQAEPSGRFVVGIDLGTTHTLAAFALRDTDEPPRVFPIPQLVTPTELEARPLFPSMLYAPLAGEVTEDPFGDAPFVAGELARCRGSEVQGRLVASAKSWLCHPGVDRFAPILPWGAQGELPRISPVDASARYLAHVRRAWDAAHPDDPLAFQEAVLTIPASFDDVARELTREAAERAGLTVRLLEEPQAAFYDYLSRTTPGELERLAAAAPSSEEGLLVLVVDIGGGTTDLSLIRIGAKTIRRVAVGNHLLLGGDNMDLALAARAEERMGQKLDPQRFLQLVAECRTAKERLLGEAPPERVNVTVLGHGRNLVGSALSATLTREDAETLVVEAFFPMVGRDARPEKSRAALVSLGLPYERDPAITKHIAHFLAKNLADGERVGALLFNGGVFHASAVAKRVTHVLTALADGVAPILLPQPDPDLGVARGAVAYGNALLGRGRRIESGTAHGYYVALDGETEAGETRPAVCVVPRGAEEGIRSRAAGRTFGLVVGRPVRFDLFRSDGARDDAPGDLVRLDEEAFVRLPPVAVVFDEAGPTSLHAAGRRPSVTPESREAREIRVAIEGELTAVGTLELACVDLETARRYRLAFQLRGEVSPQLPRVARTSSVPEDRGPLAEAIVIVDRVFGKPRADVRPREAKDLLRDLERTLGPRSDWTMEVSRRLFDALALLSRGRKRSADHERLFWLLAGYTVRPGFGDVLDATRVRSAFALFAERLAFGSEARGWQQFFIAWRRMAGGLDEEAQTALRDFVDPFIAPVEAGLKRPKKLHIDAFFEMLELAAALERVPVERRIALGTWIVERTWTERDPRLWAALGRIGARAPAYASIHHVIPPVVAERWIDHALREKWTRVPSAMLATVEIARRTGDRARDVGERVSVEVLTQLARAGAPESLIARVREVTSLGEEEQAAFWGESLPVGLRLVD